MINGRLKITALSFIYDEKERTVQNLKSGTISKENAIGSIGTLYQIASHLKDAETMSKLSSLISLIRSKEHFGGFFDPYFERVSEEEEVGKPSGAVG
ncbi:hypothetical protein [Paenibacillus thermotolerans]|uniref:hypothetical protein n=1 Tax=Paenibacillus thermotolerans TaxID=3027807 RepID=UPI002367E1FF|nr:MULTISPECIES: hypothetical protein [unclassified Paenibacillus]